MQERPACFRHFIRSYTTRGEISQFSMENVEHVHSSQKGTDPELLMKTKHVPDVKILGSRWEISEK